MQNNIQYLRCQCYHCGQRVEFPDYGVGTQIDCPSCGGKFFLHGPIDTTIPLAGKIKMVLIGGAMVACLVWYCVWANNQDSGRSDHYDQTIYDVTHVDKAKSSADKVVDDFLQGKR